MMTASGLERTLKEHQIKTVINLMEEEPDPKLRQTYFNGGKVLERDICDRLGVKFIYLQADTIPLQQSNRMAPKAIGEFLAIMNDPANHPVLLHCRAGLHRTGVLSAVYRMEYDKWSPARAWMELRDNGFGEFNCYPDNDYIMQYIHQPAAKNQAQQ
jgi:protein tyrosine/serine phosphatase